MVYTHFVVMFFLVCTGCHCLFSASYALLLEELELLASRSRIEDGAASVQARAHARLATALGEAADHDGYARLAHQRIQAEYVGIQTATVLIRCCITTRFIYM